MPCFCLYHGAAANDFHAHAHALAHAPLPPLPGAWRCFAPPTYLAGVRQHQAKTRGR